MKYDKPQPQTIAGLNVYSEADLPFGKQFQMGRVIYTIYDRAVESGYQAGIQAHLALIQEMELDTPLAPDDEQFIALLNGFTPKELSSENAKLWRAHFIAGWVAVFLGLIDLREVLPGLQEA